MPSTDYNEKKRNCLGLHQSMKLSLDFTKTQNWQMNLFSLHLQCVIVDGHESFQVQFAII